MSDATIPVAGVEQDARGLLHSETILTTRLFDAQGTDVTAQYFGVTPHVMREASYPDGVSVELPLTPPPAEAPSEREWLAAHLEAVITPDPDGSPGLYDMSLENGTRLTGDQLRRVIAILRAAPRAPADAEPDTWIPDNPPSNLKRCPQCDARALEGEVYCSICGCEPTDGGSWRANPPAARAPADGGEP